MTSEIKEIVIECFADVAAELNEESDRVISSLTEFEGFLGQDIILSGRLLNSKVVDASDTKITLAWTAKNPDNGFYYPAAIIAGFFAYGGTKYIEGRNFPARTAKNVDPVKSLVDKLKSKGVKAKVKRNNIALIE